MIACGARAQLSATEAASDIGITPESIVLAGVEEHTNSILTVLNTAANTRQLLATAHGLRGEAADEITIIRGLLAARGYEPELLAEYRAAIAELTRIRENIASIQDQLFGDATNALPMEAVEVLRDWQVAAQYRVPEEFRVLEQTADDWKLIEKACRAERRAQRRGERLAQEYVDLLARIRSNEDVIAAGNRLSANLASVEQTFRNYQPGG